MPFNDLGALAQWNPSTNSPKLVSGKGQEGMIYRCSAAATRALDDNSEWNANDLVAYSALMGKWFRLGPANISTDAEILAGTDNQKVVTPKKLKTLMDTWGFVSVKAYGATGDGVTDDTLACQAAIDAAAGKVLLWPSGVYKVTQLTVRAATQWWGLDPSASRIERFGTAQNDLITATSIGWVSFNNLHLRGGDVSTALPVGNASFNLCTHFSFHNCYFDQFYVLGLAFQGSTFVDVDNCWFFKTNSDHALNQGFLNGIFTGPSNNISVRNSYFSNCGNIIQGQSIVFENNVATNWGYGAGVSTGLGAGHEFARIAFNYLSSATGIDADGFSLKGIENWSPYSTVIGNICNGNSGPGIYHAGKNGSVVGNVCLNNDTLGEAFIGGINIAYSTADLNGSGTVVSGNRCADSGPGTQDYGCVVSALCNDVSIRGNSFNGNVIAPYVVQGGSNPSIQYEDWYVPIYKAADFTVAPTDRYLLNGKGGSGCVVTLPPAANYPGRPITIMNWQAQTVTSASANVLPPTGGVGTAILAATAGKWATLVSDGAYWLVMGYN